MEKHVFLIGTQKSFICNYLYIILLNIKPETATNECIYIFRAVSLYFKQNQSGLFAIKYMYKEKNIFRTKQVKQIVLR